jgi:hypothetical protein
MLCASALSVQYAAKCRTAPFCIGDRHDRMLDVAENYWTRTSSIKLARSLSRSTNVPLNSPGPVQFSGTVVSLASKRRAKCALQGEAYSGCGGEDGVEGNETPCSELQRDSVPSRAAQGVSGKARRRMWLDAAERDGSCGVRENLRLLPKNASKRSWTPLRGPPHTYPAHEFGNAGYSPHRDEAPTASIST